MIRISIVVVCGLLCAVTPGPAQGDEDAKSALDAALAKSARDDGAGAAVELTGEARAFWRTQHEVSPLGRGTFTFRRDGRGGVSLVVDLAGLARIEYGADSVAAWEVDPVHGSTLYEGEAGDSIRRLLAVLGADGRWRRIYERAAPTRPDGSPRRRFKMFPGGDTWDVDAEGRVVAASIAHTGGGRDAMKIGVSVGEFEEAGGRPRPHALTIDREHHRYTLAVKTCRTGKDAAEPAIAPSRDIVSKARKAPVSPKGERAVEVVTLASVHTASIRKKVRLQEISAELAKMLPEIMFAVRKQGIEPLGAPFTRYHSPPGVKLDIEVGFPVAKPIEPTGRIVAGKLPGGKVATTWHVGPYKTLGQSHGRLLRWVGENGLAPRGGQWEVYWTDPGLEPDPAKWRTQLFVPVR